MDVITTHLHADCDGLAAMVAARKLYPGAALVLPGGAQDTVRRFLAVHDQGLTRLKDLPYAEVTRLIFVDTQEPERLGPLQSLRTNPAVALHIFDHHPAPAGGTSQTLCRAERAVVIERVLQQGLAFSPLEATTLTLGLYDETGSFTYVSTTPRDLQAAAAALRAGADLTIVAVRELMQWLGLSRRHSNTVQAARAARHAIPRLATRPPLSPAETYRLLVGQRLETMLFLLAKTSSEVAKQKPRLSGHDLRAMGLTPGPLFRQVLDSLLQARLNGEVTTDTEERALVQQLMRPETR
jgi:hypothetical protein